MRKYSIIITAIVCIGVASCSQQKQRKTIERMASEWADANNQRDLDKLEQLYAPSLMFYALSKDRATCLKEKKAFFDRHPDYRITLSNIDIDFYKSGVIKYNFTKTEFWDGKSGKPNTGYLLFAKEGDEFRITGESDQRMDMQRSYVPQLGAKAEPAGNLLYITGGVVTGILLLSALLYMKRRKRVPDHPIAMAAAVNPAPDITPISIPHVKEMDAREKGHMFEKYIGGLFSKEHFAIIGWSSDKIATNGLYDESNKEPDLKLTYKKSDAYRFAIECKWRQSFTINQSGARGVNWASSFQIKNYEEYANKSRIPVWVAIGIGGTPDKPEHLFFTRLSNIAMYPFVFESYLKGYKRNAERAFYYNTEDGNII